jgi:hypothetical protein
MNGIKLRWDNYLQFSGNIETESLFNNHFRPKDEQRVLFILGKGFDTRMNISAKKFLDANPETNVQFLLIEFNEGANSSSLKFMEYVAQNITEFDEITNGRVVQRKQISLWKESNGKRRRVGDIKAAEIIDQSTLEGFTDIIVDTSALPRGIYFSLLAKTLFLVDEMSSSSTPINLFVAIAENARLDMSIKEHGVDDDINYLKYFSESINITSDDKPKVWFPILGEDKGGHLQKAYNRIFEQNNQTEICPILPFPSKKPRRSDDLIKEYHEILFDQWQVEPKSIFYVPERNPFETYRKICGAVTNYNRTLSSLDGCKPILSTFSSKLLSIGMLMAAYDLKRTHKIGTAVLNVDSEGYDIFDLTPLKNAKEESELFVIWLTGDPYIE